MAGNSRAVDWISTFFFDESSERCVTFFIRMFQFHLRERVYISDIQDIHFCMYTMFSIQGSHHEAMLELFFYHLRQTTSIRQMFFAGSKIILYILISFIQWQNFAFLWQSSSAKEWFIDSKHFFWTLIFSGFQFWWLENFHASGSFICLPFVVNGQIRVFIAAAVGAANDVSKMRLG